MIISIFCFFFLIFSTTTTTTTVAAAPVSAAAAAADAAPASLTRIADHYSGSLDRHKRYVIRAKRWKKYKLFWKLLPDNLQEADLFIIRNTIHRAFNEWSTVSSLQFQESPSDSKADIYIAFMKGDHKDGFPFDGEDGVVAHAFYPRDGRLHFDADESWSLNTNQGVNLFQTAVHEIGHLLGLEHSMDYRAAMFAAKRPYDPAFTLGDDDVRAIRALFPSKTSKPQPTTTTPSTSTSTSASTSFSFFNENSEDPFDFISTPTTTSSSSNDKSFFPFPLPELEYFQRRNDWFVL